MRLLYKAVLRASYDRDTWEEDGHSEGVGVVGCTARVAI
jgi:hypothetical protein